MVSRRASAQALIYAADSPLFRVSLLRCDRKPGMPRPSTDRLLDVSIVCCLSVPLRDLEDIEVGHDSLPAWLSGSENDKDIVGDVGGVGK